MLFVTPLVWGALASDASPCTLDVGYDYYIPNQGPTGHADNATDCCNLCRGFVPSSPVLPPVFHYTPFFTYTSSQDCYCKSSQGRRGKSPGTISGSCGPAMPTPAPTPPTPNYQGCMSELAKALPYCNMSMSYDERTRALVSSLTLAEKVSRMYSCVDTCDTCSCPVDRVGLPPFAYLLETNTAVATVCLEKGRCATVFPGPLGLGGSFNKTVWFQKGKVLGTEVRAFNNNR